MKDSVQEVPLQELSDWKLVHPKQDVRGWPVQDSNGRPVGSVRTLLANTDSELVEYLVLDNGSTIPASQVKIGDGVVTASGELGMTNYEDLDDAQFVVVYDEEAPAGYDAYRNEFQAHCADTFSATDADFDRYEPAYRFGYINGADPRYAEQSFDRLDPEVRTRYEAQFGAGTYDQARPAVSKGFSCARNYATRMN